MGQSDLQSKFTASLKTSLKYLVCARALNIKLRVGFILFLSILLIGFIGPFFIPYNPIRTGIFPRNLPPSLEHPFGTDSLGRDILAQIIVGTKMSLVIGILVSVFGHILGLGLGFISGYYGGKIDTIIRNVIDVFLAIPSLPMLILIASYIRVRTIWTIIFALVPWSWAFCARQVRGQTLSLRSREFIYMAKLSGMSGWEIILREIAPHMGLWIIGSFANGVLVAIMAESGMEILGIGPARTITLGMILFWAQFHSALFAGLWWWLFAPTMMLIIIFVSLFLIHVGFEEALRQRR